MADSWTFEEATQAESRPYTPEERQASAVSNLTQLSQELSRPGITPQQRTILEAELPKEQARRERGERDAASTFSLGEAYGTKSGLDEAQLKQDTQTSPLGAAKAIGSAFADQIGLESWKRAGAEVATLADMAISVPNMLFGLGAEQYTRAKDFLQGKSRTEMGKEGRAAYNFWLENAPQPAAKVVSMFTPPGQEPTETNVAKAMNWVMGATDAGFAKVEQASGGLVRTEDLQVARDALMAYWGTKGTVAPVKALGERVFGIPQESGAAMARDFERPEPPQPPQRPVEGAVETPSGRVVTPETLDSGLQRTVDEATGVTQPEVAGETSLRDYAARQRDVKAALMQDPRYADYLRNYAEEEARVREEAQARGESDALLEEADKATPSRIGGAEPVLLDESGKPIPRTSLDSAMDKVNKGQSFDLNAEEVLALRKAGSAWAQRDVAQLFNRETPFNPPRSTTKYGPPDVEPGTPSSPLPRGPGGRFAKRQGAIDQTLLNVLALGGVGAALAWAYPDESRKGLAALAGGAMLLGDTGKIAAHADKAPLSVLLKDSATTLKTLERLPQNRWEFKLQEVEQQLRRDDVGKAEKEVLGDVIKQQREQGHETISAKDLMLGFKLAAQDFELKEKASPEWANYGLENIDRAVESESGGPWIPEEATPREAAELQADWEAKELTVPPAKTSVWQLPLEVSTANHFRDPNYFGHTRSFVESGVKHVVEIQSDLAQKVRKAMSPEEKQQLLRDYREATMEAERLKHMPTPEALLNESVRAQTAAKTELYRQAVLRQQELEVKIKAMQEAGRAGQVEPMFKDWYKRLVREELASTMREKRAGQEWIDARNAKGEYTNWNSPEAAQQVQAARQNVVRFATADTVAKVEGWPDEARVFAQGLEAVKTNLEEARVQLSAAERRLAETRSLAEQNPGREILRDRVSIREQEVANRQRDVEHYKQQLATYQEESTKPHPRFAPEHQGIYDRYKRDVEKFLRQLGGKDYTDAYGHTWIDVPVQPGMARAQMFGRASPEMLGKLALVVGATVLGTNFDKNHKFLGGLFGFLGGAALASGVMRNFGQRVKQLYKPDPSVAVDKLGNQYAGEVASARMDAALLARKIVKEVPQAADREAITRAVDSGNIAALRGKSLEVARRVVEMIKSARQQAWDANVLKSAAETYAIRMYDLTPAEMDTLRRDLNTRKGMPNQIPTIAQMEALGFRPRSLDVADFAETYVTSLVEAVARKNLIQGLRETKIGDVPALTPAREAPPSYVASTHPQLRPYAIHPEISDALKFFFDQTDNNTLMRAAEALNTTVKRIQVSSSLFHIGALHDAAMAAGRNPLFGAKTITLAALGRESMLKQLYAEGMNEVQRRLVKNGLVISLEHALPGVEDASKGFYDGMRGVQKMLDDAAIPFAGKAVAGFAKANHAFDNLMWGRIHAALKLQVATKAYTQLLENGATEEAAAAAAAKYTNRLFGGLDWRREANSFTSGIGRKVANALLNPESRRWLRFAEFALDWTYSTTAAFTSAIVGKGSGLRGLVKPTTLADLHRQYLVRSLVYYGAIANALNLYWTGHPLGQDERGRPVDPTFVSMGDGRKMQLSKHAMEPFHWAMHPVQQFINKMGYFPREFANQLAGTEFLYPHEDPRTGQVTAGPKMQEGRLMHAMKAASPFTIQQIDKGGLESGVAGALGRPIYGETRDQREARRRRERLDRLERQRQAAMEAQR